MLTNFRGCSTSPYFTEDCTSLETVLKTQQCDVTWSETMIKLKINAVDVHGYTSKSYLNTGCC